MYLCGERRRRVVGRFRSFDTSSHLKTTLCHTTLPTVRKFVRALFSTRASPAHHSTPQTSTNSPEPSFVNPTPNPQCRRHEFVVLQTAAARCLPKFSSLWPAPTVTCKTKQQSTRGKICCFRIQGFQATTTSCRHVKPRQDTTRRIYAATRVISHGLYPYHLLLAPPSWLGTVLLGRLAGTQSR